MQTLSGAKGIMVPCRMPSPDEVLIKPVSAAIDSVLYKSASPGSVSAAMLSKAVRSDPA